MLPPVSIVQQFEEEESACEQQHHAAWDSVIKAARRRVAIVENPIFLEKAIQLGLKV